MAKYKNIAGQRFGKLIAYKYVSSGGAAQHARWQCFCDCGNETEAAGAYLRRGNITSCGCAGVDARFKPTRLDVPGASSTRTYRIWTAMIIRCSYAAKGNAKKHYFDRGIKVCNEWQSYAKFLADMGEVDDIKSIDRIDVNGNYELSNCRWATVIEQANNTRANHFVTCYGKTLTVANWARELGIKCNTLTYRLRRGISPERALSANMKNNV